MKKLMKFLRNAAYLLALAFRNPLATRHDPACPSFANIGEGTYEHGLKLFIPDAATTSRYLLYKAGAGVNGPAANSCTLTTAITDYPLGTSDDQADSDALTQGIAIGLLGAVKGTRRVISDGTIVNGSRLGPSGVTAGYATIAASGAVCFGTALVPSDTVVAAGQPVEYIPAYPAKYVTT